VGQHYLCAQYDVACEVPRDFVNGLASVRRHVTPNFAAVPREIIRCLKRFVAREIFGYLCHSPKPIYPEQIAA